MLGGLADYGSDSGSDSEPEQVSVKAAPAAPAPAAANGEPPKKKRKGPLKIGLDLPKPSDESTAEEDKGPAPKPKKAVGAGASALLNMLPPPKRKLPTSTTASRGTSLAVNKSMAAKPAAPSATDDLKASLGATGVDEDDGPSLVPASVKRKAAQEETLDLFGLSSSAAPKPSLPKPTLKPPSISSAPPVAEFVPPEPTAADPYPGYYQLPSGQWAAYDAAYYASFFPSAGSSAASAVQKEQNAKVDRLGNWKELDDGRASITEFDVGATISKAREEQAKIPQHVKPSYGGEEYKAVGNHKGLANDRHQLTSLLHSAFSQREELEERIRANKKAKQNTQRQYGF